jgi:hypothetical protein
MWLSDKRYKRRQSNPTTFQFYLFSRGGKAMMYIVHYVDDNNTQHITFVSSYKEVNFIKERFGEITIESYKIEE